QRLFREIDTFDFCTAPRHRLGQDSAAAADVERRFSGELRDAVDPLQAQRIDLVERLELALRIPPAVRERAEFFQFLRIGVHLSGCHPERSEGSALRYPSGCALRMTL